MAFVLLGISCLPCNDDIIAITQTKAQTEIGKQHDHGKMQDHTDNCTPFCHCTCCAGFSFNHPVTEKDSIIPFHATKHTPQYTASVIEISLPVWQPPQLV